MLGTLNTKIYNLDTEGYIYCKAGYNKKDIYIDNENINMVHLKWR